jgi:U3 small nucleolar ribonucleoprotein component
MDSNLEKGDNDKADITQVEDVSPSTASDEVPTALKNAYAVKGDESDGKVVWKNRCNLSRYALCRFVPHSSPMVFHLI